MNTCKIQRMIRKMKVLLPLLLLLAFMFPKETYAWNTPYATLTICAYGDPGTDAILGERGHTWLVITNDSPKPIYFMGYEIAPGDSASVSIWPDTYKHTYGHGGVFINLERYGCDGEKCTSYSIPITQSDLEKIANATPAESYYHDGIKDGDLHDDLLHNCTSYSTQMWNMVADDDHQISDGYQGIDIPGTVENKIRRWDGSKIIIYKPTKPKYWRDVFYVDKNGEYTGYDKLLISDIGRDLKVGETFTLTAFFENDPKVPANFTWETSDPKVATVSGGTITAVGEGQCTIRATYAGLYFVTCAVKVTGPKKITLNKTSASIYIGNSVTLKAKKSKNLTGTVKWKSSNKSIATVSSSGKVTGKKAGTATITAYIGKVKATCKITVKKLFDLKDYVDKDYTKLVKKLPKEQYWDKYQDPAGTGNLYMFDSNNMSFFRYNIKTKKVSVVQNSDQKNIYLYGVKLGMTAAKAKSTLKSNKWAYKKKENGGGGYWMTFSKSTHTIRLLIVGGKVSSYQWY